MSDTNCTASIKTIKKLATLAQVFWKKNILSRTVTQQKCAKNAKTAEHLSSKLTAPNSQHNYDSIKNARTYEHKMRHISTRTYKK